MNSNLRQTTLVDSDRMLLIRKFASRNIHLIAYSVRVTIMCKLFAYADTSHWCFIQSNWTSCWH